MKNYIMLINGLSTRKNLYGFILYKTRELVSICNIPNYLNSEIWSHVIHADVHFELDFILAVQNKLYIVF